MKSLKTLVPAVLVSAAAAAPAFAAESVRYSDGAVPHFADGCPAAATFKLIPDPSAPKIELYLPNFVAVATAANDYVTRNCVVSVGLKAPEGYQIAPGTLTFEGKATVSSQGDADITALYYLDGTESVKGYQSFSAGYNDLFTLVTTYGAAAATVCGGDATFNFMADLTAAFAGGGGRSEVKVQRGFATVDVPVDTPVFKVGLKLIRCF